MSFVADVLICLRFFSRLPVPTTGREIALGAEGFAAAAALAPVAGALIALIPAVVLAFALALGIPVMVAAALALAASTLVTGALHEDALADCCDGFGGGRSQADKLAIMRDSRIGAFGAVAIALAVLVRATALGAAAEQGMSRGIAALVTGAALSRAVCLVPLLLPAARRDGAGHAAAAVGRTRVAISFCLAVTVAVGFALLPGSGTGPLTVVLAVLMSALAAAAMAALAWRQIGGHTGDVAGATQQIAEAAVLVVFATAAR